jgi:hypothetical protein
MRRAASALFALGAVLTVTACQPVKGPAPRARVLVYGDSFILEAQPYLAAQVGASGVEAVPRQFPGIALCDVLGRIPGDVAEFQPRVAVLQFAGQAGRPCIDQRTGTLEEKYAADVEVATALLRERGVTVLWVGIPLGVGSAWARSWTSDLFADAAARWGPPVYYDDRPALSLFDQATGTFTSDLPCLGHESAYHGCSGGRIRVRSATDGQHFCPDGGYPCGLYASGGHRFGTTIGAIVLSLL